MNTLHDDLEIIRELNLLRERAKELRERALRPLRNIKSIEYSKDHGVPNKRKKILIAERDRRVCRMEDWLRSGNEVEIALVTKIQNHPDLSVDDDNNNTDATPELKRRLLNLPINEFFPEIRDLPSSLFDAQPTVSVLMAARAMQTLVSRSNTVFSEATMYCYYRIVRELYVAGTIDWTVGAARAGSGGRTSAFVTGECVRAIFAFEDSIKRTARFFESVRQLNARYCELKRTIESLGDAGKDESHPLRRRANRVMERMWLDCQISTNPRGGQIAHFFNSEEKDSGIDQPNQLLPPDIDNPPAGQEELITLKTVEDYLASLKVNLPKALQRAQVCLENAEKKVAEFRMVRENPYDYSGGTPTLKEEYRLDRPENRAFINTFHRTESAHLTASQMIRDAVTENEDVTKIVEKIGEDLDKTLDELITKAENIAQRIHRVANPIRQYIKTVIRREFAVASSPSASAFDAGELVFAATAYGTMTDWKPSELLDRACQLLRDVLPENGRLVTRRPLHSSQHGYRLIPIGCEMTRCLAQLFQKTNYEIDPVMVKRMLNIFEDNPIPLSNKKGKEMVGWNFENSPHPNKPSVWVSAVAVLSLDRIVRMLNSRINNIILKHFDVYRPDKPHIDRTLNNLIYGDFGFSLHGFYGLKEEVYKKLCSIPISLELMRAHVMRASLPKSYVAARNTPNPVFSVIFYGPPGTGKTTLAEATALSAQAPVVNLSPNDLLVQGQQFIEGRARDVFDALSMLTQVVIILDEFEPILERRVSDESTSSPAAARLITPGEPADAHAPAETTEFTTDLSQRALAQIAAHLEGMSQQVDPQLRFLVAGMLPRLLRLHDLAKKQSVAYCLATNHLVKIDDAAKRTGRFDLTIPVYNPCPVSRAGSLLLVLVRIKSDLKLEGETLRRFVKVLAHTTNEPAGELAGNYFKSKGEEGSFTSRSKYLDYILQTGPDVKLDFTKADKIRDPESNTDKLENSEVNERRWLIEFEKALQAEAKRVDEDGGKSSPDLKKLLSKFDFDWIEKR
jgi:DNA polymerase III delta prime subunit